MAPMEPVIPCPLCGMSMHAGKCPKATSGEWWCGVCVTNRLSASDLDGPPLPPVLLLAAGINRTKNFCSRCGSTVCEDHGWKTKSGKAMVRCSGEDCRGRSKARVGLLRKALDIYVPGYLGIGPRCRACRLPAYREELCARHYTHILVRKNKDYVVERQMKYRGFPVQRFTVCLRPSALELARRAARAKDLSLANWVSKIIERELGVDTQYDHSVFTDGVEE